MPDENNFMPQESDEEPRLKNAVLGEFFIQVMNALRQYTLILS